MPELRSERDRLLDEARDRGRRWAEYRVTQIGHIWKRLGPMSDDKVRKDIVEACAGFLPLEGFASDIVLACYTGARDEIDRLYDEQKARAKERR